MAEDGRRGLHASARRAFVAAAGVDQRGFYNVLEARFEPALKGLAQSPFAGFVFRGFAGDAPGSRVCVQALGVALDTVEKIMQVTGVSASTSLSKEEWRAKLFNAARPLDTQVEAEAWRRYCEQADVDEVFSRYDTDRNGSMCAGEVVMMVLTTQRILAAFTKAAEGKKTIGLKQMVQVFTSLGFAALQLQHAPILFNKLRFAPPGDREAQGGMEAWEMVQGCCRMLRPVNLLAEAQALAGWPGWECFRHNVTPASPLPRVKSIWEPLRDGLDTLQTGDLLLLKLTDEVGRFMSFAADTIWTHVCIVINHDVPGRAGQPHVATQQLLEDATFRWGTHRFCSPRYCRCFATESSREAVARMKGVPISHVELLEATGQGVHVYNLAARLFVGFNAARTGTVALRRLKKAPGRGDAAKVEEFISAVRGHLYHVDADDGLKSMHCAQLVGAFYDHMGWLSPHARQRPFAEFMPQEFAAAEARSFLADGVEFEPLELIRDEWNSAPLPMPRPTGGLPKMLSGGSRIPKPKL